MNNRRNINIDTEELANVIRENTTNFNQEIWKIYKTDENLEKIELLNIFSLLQFFSLLYFSFLKSE